MSSSTERLKPVPPERFLRALLSAPRPGAEKILAFYDHRAGLICTDPSLLLVPLDYHLCHRGDGLFESICYRDGLIFALDAHLDRLEAGAAALCIDLPLQQDALRARIRDVAAASSRDHGDLRVFLSRGPGGFGISPRECPSPGLYIVAAASKLPGPAIYEKGLTAFTSAYPPKQEYLAKIKNTNYLPNVLMAAEALAKEMDVAITFDENGHMGEAAIANVAIVDKEGRLVSPEITRILPGTTLLAALELAAERMPVRQEPVHRQDILQAREMLLFTSSTLCVAITHFDGHPIGQGIAAGRPGPVALWLKDALLQKMKADGTPYK